MDKPHTIDPDEYGRRIKARRYYTPDKAGPPCPECGKPTVKSLVDAERVTTHPACQETD